MKRKLHPVWRVWGEDTPGVPSGRDVIAIGGAVVFGDFRVTYCRNNSSSLGRWIVEWLGAVGTSAPTDAWFEARRFDRYREACAEARRLEMERLGRFR